MLVTVLSTGYDPWRTGCIKRLVLRSCKLYAAICTFVFPQFSSSPQKQSMKCVIILRFQALCVFFLCILHNLFQHIRECVQHHFFMPRVFSWICPQTYSQLAHPIQQARALGLLFQSKILDIDNIDVSAFTLLQQPSHTQCNTLHQTFDNAVISGIVYPPYLYSVFSS